MKKYLYPGLLLVFGLLATAIFFFKKPEQRMPELLERRGDLSAGKEWLNTKAAIEGLQAKLRSNPDDHKSRLLLAQAFMQEARVTGDHPYYDGAAMELLDVVLRAEPENFEALCCKASLCLTQHHFAQGLGLAQQAQKINPNSGFVYGLLTDANVEMGHYEEAVKMADKMNLIRPDLAAYARVSYLREIYGDVPGAIQAMDMAAKAGYMGLEQTEWTRVGLGHLHEVSGDTARARGYYLMALAARPGYAYALAGLGRMAAARKDYPRAIKLYQQARLTVKDYAFTDELTDLYRLNGQPEESQKMAKESIAMLASAAEEADDNEQMGHYADRELAYAYLKTNELDKALEHAKIEYERRPDNIDVNETMAWVLYKRGSYAEAQKYMQMARRTNSQNPVLLCRAGLILTKLGKTAEGQALIEKSLKTAPYLDSEVEAEGKKLLAAR
ncbi:tetratricopeptide repeat protein [Hymenobacter sp.]|uniref:tetratricopeptide repeat protein n=1 Tax=Hymenobacter sp. TaxID=1898978 RepID=UPI00286D216C|nr:tetratricopeptide repeat protein [Hymenobacter sp.]